VAFPGGRLDEGESFEQAAIREAQEEIGLDPSLVRVLGYLDPLRTATTRFRVQPIVVSLGSRPTLHANEDEVERIFDHSIAELLSPGVYHEELWDRSDLGLAKDSHDELHILPVSFFDVGSDLIWGLTGRFLVQVIHLLAGTTPRPLPTEIDGRPIRNVFEIDDSV
jgi:8-oxo-dGTP pyrophosphatase MutT (NUDIX family)